MRETQNYEQFLRLKLQSIRFGELKRFLNKISEETNNEEKSVWEYKDQLERLQKHCYGIVTLYDEIKLYNNETNIEEKFFIAAEKKFEIGKEMLQEKVQHLEKINNPESKNEKFTNTNKPLNYAKPSFKFEQNKINARCMYCKQNDHNIQQCMHFKNINTYDRYQFIKTNYLCYNCLTHNAKDGCKSASTCKISGQRHHILIHQDNAYSAKKYDTQNDNSKILYKNNFTTMSHIQDGKPKISKQMFQTHQTKLNNSSLVGQVCKLADFSHKNSWKQRRLEQQGKMYPINSVTNQPIRRILYGFKGNRELTITDRWKFTEVNEADSMKIPFHEYKYQSSKKKCLDRNQHRKTLKNNDVAIIEKKKQLPPSCRIYPRFQYDESAKYNIY